MNFSEMFWAGQRILAGRRPVLSIEITRECPLRCPGCYAYEDAHLGGGVALRELTDRRGSELVDSVLQIVESHKPLRLYIVGGDPLVRLRELDALLPELSRRRLPVSLVTSAFRPIPEAWAELPLLSLNVSVDGLPAEHNERRKPATYDRILRNIRGHQVSIHCTLTGQMMQREGYIEEFVRFWSDVEETREVRFSMFTPQRGDHSPECLTAAQREQAIHELLGLRPRFPKLKMHELLIRAFASPPASPDECLFAQVTETLSADFETRVEPCQFGGDPDCSRCGCMGSVGLEVVKNYRLAGLVPIGSLFNGMSRMGRTVAAVTR